MKTGSVFWIILNRQKAGLAPTFVLNNKTNKKINLKK